MMIRDEIASVADQPHVDAARRPWTTPSVQKLRAGSAEDSSGPATDAITNPS